MTFGRVLKELEGSGLLMLSDKALPSVVGIVGGGKVKGSWWGHKKRHKIFWDLKRLEANPDVMTTRLVSSKVTYLHRRLWPEFLAIALSEESWQTRKLSSGARGLLRLVREKGEIRLDKLRGSAKPGDLGAAARELEGRLLVYSEEIHTERGTHTKALMAWTRFPKIRDQRLSAVSPASARDEFESIISGLNRKYHASATLPWAGAVR